VDRKEIMDELDRSFHQQERFQRIVFVEPRAEDLLQILTHPWLPDKVIVLANLARTAQTLQRIRLLLNIEGIEPVKDKLIAGQKELERALGGHTIDIADLDSELLPPRFGTLDLTGASTHGYGALRTLRASGDLRIRAFDGTEVALYDPDALQAFSRKLAKDLQPGDQICVFSPDFMSMARVKLNLTANASEVLALYHKSVADAVQKLPGGDVIAKIVTLRERMFKLDPTLTLPSPQAMRYWIEVAGLIDKPRNTVRPQAPRDPKHYLCFMKALGISEQVARHYWDLGIVWTRSMRISTGASFHQAFMSILIDPYGTASRLSEERRHEIWRIYDAAQDHIVTVLSNEHGEGA
jgi:hypothetical protein